MYFSRTQLRDGSRAANSDVEFIRPQFPAPHTGDGDRAVTALAILAFLSAKHVPGESHYGEVVTNGICFIAAVQQANGLIAVRNNGGTGMYYHGIGTLMLAEVVGMTSGD